MVRTKLVAWLGRIWRCLNSGDVIKPEKGGSFCFDGEGSLKVLVESGHIVGGTKGLFCQASCR